MGQEITESFSMVCASFGPNGKPSSLVKELGSIMTSSPEKLTLQSSKARAISVVSDGHGIVAANSWQTHQSMSVPIRSFDRLNNPPLALSSS
jgi:hypothetical protein